MNAMNEKSNFVFEFQPVTKLFEEQVRLHPGYIEGYLHPFQYSL